MFLVTDGTTGSPTTAIIVDREDQLDDAIHGIAWLAQIDRHTVVVNPIGEPYDWVAKVTSTKKVSDLEPPPSPSTPDQDSWIDEQDFPMADWRYEVANEYTRRGYADWVAAMREEAREDEASNP
jgi:hypothetical protein